VELPVQPARMSIPDCLETSRPARRTVLTLAALSLAAGHRSAGADSTTSTLLQRDRAQWVREGEAALAKLEIDEARSAFERAAAIEHSADAEMGLVRAYMQAGEYRRALAFVAHTAVAHRGDSGGTALYVWLLNAAGNADHANRILRESQPRYPADPLLRDIAEQLSRPVPLTTALLLRPPARLAPYSGAIEKGAQILGNGVLIGRGERALVPNPPKLSRSKVWVRNALGKVSRVRIEHRLGNSGFSIGTLEQPLMDLNPIRVSAKPPFPGSVAHIVNFASVAGLQAQWPLLHSGFLGSLRADKSRALGIELLFRSHGAPVFDANGALIGISVSERPGQSSLLSCAELPLPPSLVVAAESMPSPPSRIARDEIYETALRIAVQTIAL
jgi:tetratricopeptide (TPR) repeat protein